MKYLITIIMIFVFSGCAGFNFGYKDPEAGVDVTCKTVEGITNCSYMDPSGKEIFVDFPEVGKEPVPAK